MPPRQIISKISDEVREQLDTMLRARNYGEFVRISEWLLKAHNVRLGKSSIGRYSKELKAKDIEERLMAENLRANLVGRSVNELLAELGSLRVREHCIIKRLASIGFIDEHGLEKATPSAPEL